jgi:signal transduction histidine kinase
MLEGRQLQIMYGARAAREVTYNMTFAVDSIPRIWAAASRGEAVVLSDIHAEDDPLASELRDACGPELMSTHFARLKSWVAVPLSLQDRVIGMLAVSHNDSAHFTRDNTQLVRAVAHQAAIAIENARLYEQAEDRTRELSALLEVSNSVASTIQLGPLVAVILEQIRKILDYDRASVLTLDGDALVVLDTIGQPAMAPGQNQRPLRFPIARLPQIWQALQRNELLIIEDLYSDDPFAKELRELVGDDLLQTLYPHVKSFMSVPLMLHDRPIGVLALSGPEPGFFRRDEKHLVMAVASQAAVAIENARLYQQASQLAAVEERQRLARELHDSVSQALYGIALGARTARTQLDRDPARAAEPVDYVLSLAEAGLAEMRALIFELRPESLELEGLVAGLEKQASAMRARHHVEVEATLCEEPDVSLRVKEAISRIAQEALHNTVKHARATHVDLKLQCTEDELAIEIRDNGAGFDPDGDFPGHLGLRSMRERAAKLGGTVQIESKPGEGTRIVASVPIESSA